MKLNDSELKAFRIFDSQQVAEIKKGVDTGVDVLLYADTRFDCEQMREILLGLQQGADVSLYADPDRYYAAQMQQIRLGLLNGVDVSQYADPSLDWRQMEKIREQLEEGLGNEREER